MSNCSNSRNDSDSDWGGGIASSVAMGKRPATAAAVARTRIAPVRAVKFPRRYDDSDDSGSELDGGSNESDAGDWGAMLRREVISISSSDSGSDRKRGNKRDDTYNVRRQRASTWVSSVSSDAPDASGDQVSGADRTAAEPRVAVRRAGAVSCAAKLKRLEDFIMKDAARDPHAFGQPVHDERRLLLGDWAIDVQGKQRPTGNVWDWAFVVSYQGLRHSIVHSMMGVARAIRGPVPSLGASSANVSGSAASGSGATDVPPEPVYTCQVCTEEFSFDSLNDCNNQEVFHPICNQCAVQTLGLTHQVVFLCWCSLTPIPLTHGGLTRGVSASCPFGSSCCTTCVA